MQVGLWCEWGVIVVFVDLDTSLTSPVSNSANRRPATDGEDRRDRLQGGKQRDFVKLTFNVMCLYVGAEVARSPC